MSQLAMLVDLLDRDDVSEVVIATGRPVALRSDGGYRPISRAPVSRAQLVALIAGTPLVQLVEAGHANQWIDLLGRRLLVEVQPLGDEVMLRLTRPARQVQPAPPVRIDPRAKSPTDTGGRAKKTTDSGGRAKTLTQSGANPAQVPARPAPQELPVRPAPQELPVRPAPQELPVRPSPPRSPPVNAGPRPPSPKALIDLVQTARRRNASDLHLAPDQPAMLRTLGSVVSLGQPLDAATVDSLLLPLLDEQQRFRLDERGYIDCAIDFEGGRLRANVSRVRGGTKGSFRLIIAEPPTLESLHLPRELARITTYHQGLVVIAGPGGHGKTTTLAALVDLINSTKAHHILTIEDPVEVRHPPKRSVISQREVGSHTRSFVTALKASLREDPDVIVIGELRDRETVEIALTAAETGHLVMATMATPSAAKTLDRLIDMFPADDQQQVRVSLAAALKFVVAQRLLPNLDGTGVAVAVELLTGVLPLAALIRDNKLFQVGSLQQRGRAHGMIRLDDSLLELVRTGQISEEVALKAAENRREMTSVLHPAEASAPAGAAPGAKRFGGLFGGDKRGGS